MGQLLHSSFLQIAFIGSTNSSRSIMIEAIAKTIRVKSFVVHSAGNFPSGKINNDVIQTLKNNNINIHDLHSKSVEDLPLIKYDLIVMLDANSQDKSNSVWIDSYLSTVWPIKDPANIRNHTQRKLAYQALFEKIKNILIVLDYLIFLLPNLLENHNQFIKQELL
jgi:protein-tyrosine-phosphatase